MDETGHYLKKACLAWGMLWIVYNVVLLLEGMASLLFLRNLGERADHLCPNVFGSWVWYAIILFGVVANAFYCLGPIAETSACVVFGRRMGRARYILFASGLLFSMYIIFALGVRGWSHIGGYLL